MVATVLPANATNQIITWASSNASGASVSTYGEVTGIIAGSTTITAKAGDKTATCAVKAKSLPGEGVFINGYFWATRNLVSHGKFVENPEDYGALFQWGRKGDGHEQRTSPNYPTNDNSVENGVVSGSDLDANGQIVSTHAAYGKFIKTENTFYDWCTPKNDVLWNRGTETTPRKTENDPCPAGWRVPTSEELQSLNFREWGTLNGVSGFYFGDGANKLFLPAAGYRHCRDGEVIYLGEYGQYWSSSDYFSSSYYLDFSRSYMKVKGDYRAFGRSVRCIADL